MNILKPAEIIGEIQTNPIFFGGEVKAQTLLTPNTSKSFRSAIVTFAPGARTRLHTHTSDQMLIVTQGKGIVATEKEEISVGAGDIIVFPAGEKHWHGATKDSSFSHIHIQSNTSTSNIVE